MSLRQSFTIQFYLVTLLLVFWSVAPTFVQASAIYDLEDGIGITGWIETDWIDIFDLNITIADTTFDSTDGFPSCDGAAPFRECEYRPPSSEGGTIFMFGENDGQPFWGYEDPKDNFPVGEHQDGNLVQRSPDPIPEPGTLTLLGTGLLGLAGYRWQQRRRERVQVG